MTKKILREPNTLIKAHFERLGDGKTEKFTNFIPDTEANFLHFALAFLLRNFSPFFTVYVELRN